MSRGLGEKAEPRDDKGLALAVLLGNGVIPIQISPPQTPPLVVTLRKHLVDVKVKREPFFKVLLLN